MPDTVASLQKEGYLTAKQAKGLNATFALDVGKKNKKNKRKPKASLSKGDWEKLKESRKKKGKK
jgi:hypothetical protein